jgi:Fur family zinc uptake transcriptional regulator
VKQSPQSPPVDFCRHDHASCKQDVLRSADQRAKNSDLRLTSVRRRALEILLENHAENQCAMGAYDVLERLAQDGFGNQPPVAYRALDFLVQNGLAHRVRRLNAYAACVHPETDHTPVFMICRKCDVVAEDVAEDVGDAISEAAIAADFLAERVNVEVLGLCASCREGAS